MAIRLQDTPFSPGAELERFIAANPDAGGIGSFIGKVRRSNSQGKVLSLTLEHYPAMTEHMLREIETQACHRWPLQSCLIIHRFGRLHPGEPIVLVATAATHRDAALTACTFLIDWLKTKAPFWKQEQILNWQTGDIGSGWVDARAEDEAAAARWE